MKYNELDTVVLAKDLTAAGLKAGDVGTVAHVVHVHKPDAFEVEFVTASGKTKALLTLSVEDVRPTEDSDLLSVRDISASG
jgi:hypothetical protein